MLGLGVMKNRNSFMKGSSDNQSLLSFRQTLAWFTFSLVLPEVYEQLKTKQDEYKYRERNQTIVLNNTTTDYQQEALNRRGVTRRRIIYTAMITLVSRTIPLLRLMNFIVFLYDGKETNSSFHCSPPSLAMKLAGIQYTVNKRNSVASPPTANGGSGENSNDEMRPLNFGWMQKRLLWETVLLLVSSSLPLNPSEYLNILDLRQRFSRLFSWKRRKYKTSITRNDPEQQQRPCCVVCEMDQCAVYYITSCGHVFCYICLRNAIALESPNANSYKCYECRTKVTWSRRL